MCGIVGAVGMPSFDVSFDALVASLSHRGPDAQGVFEEQFNGQNIRLGHRRLSIIDVSERANQPFEKNGLILVFNGEIYNFRELRSQIEASGVRFFSDSDTEVILEAWRLWGAESLPRLRGMFAFALYDRRDGRLILARDPFGMKPLFVLRRESRFAFASELKTLLPILGSDAALDETGVVASLVYGWLPDEFCMFRHVTKLLPGRWLDRRTDGTVTEHVYWDPVRGMAGQELDQFDVEHLRSVLQDTVRTHMVSDVPVGGFLSGGLDSSLVVVLARKHVDHMDCFTISFRAQDQKYEAMPNDLTYARQVARTADVKLHEIIIGPDHAKMLPQMVEILDEPIGEGAAINTYLICKAARELGIKVLLSGMGADEIFSGYRRHYACMLAERLHAGGTVPPAASLFSHRPR